MNVFSNTGFYEYQHDRTILKKLNNKIKQLRNGRMYQSKEILKHKIKKLKEKINSYQKEELKERLNKYEMKYNDNKTKFNNRNYRKRTISKYDMKKSNLIDELHWKTITDIIKTNDFIFYGDIKSHNIVKHKSNHILNKNTNDLKFYKFKQRLLEKAKEKNKVVYLVNESFTTQTCSTCGNINKLVGSSEIYKCKNKDCKIQIGRDINAAKNILMKGIVNYLF
jgi:putative transposase